MSLIHFRTEGNEAAVETHAALSLLNALVRNGVRIKHDCGGKALCGTCRVRVAEGGAAALSPVRDRERARLEAIAAEADERLACQAYAVRDVTIEVR